jgi:DNA-binding winged helix-turn-helix (wHTH) protein
MPDIGPAPRLIRFGPFEIDLRTGELWRRGIKVRLQDQAFKVLAMLLERPGDLVTREELRARLWPDSVFLDFDHGLNKAVAKARAALGDEADSPRYIETLDRRGYRFIAPTERASSRAAPGARETAMPSVHLAWGERRFPLSLGTHVIGRQADVEIWVDSPVVSRRHAALKVATGGATLQDLASRNGTFVNGRRIGAAVALAHGDLLTIGPATFRVLCVQDTEPTVTT